MPNLRVIHRAYIVELAFAVFVETPFRVHGELVTNEARDEVLAECHGVVLPLLYTFGSVVEVGTEEVQRRFTTTWATSHKWRAGLVPFQVECVQAEATNPEVRPDVLSCPYVTEDGIIQLEVLHKLVAGN